MKNNNGFWIGWLDLLTPSIRISLNYNHLTTAHNRWLPKTRSIPYWTTSAFCSIVNDLVLIYESVTSSASVVRWLTLHSWTLNPAQLLNFWILFRLTDSINYVSFLYNFGANRIEITTPNGSSTIPCLSVAAETCVNSVATLWFLQAYPLLWKHA
jgi:hypothetical protein